SRETRKKAEGTTDEGARGERSLLRLSRETRKKAEGTTDEDEREESGACSGYPERRGRRPKAQLTKTSERRAELAPAIPSDKEEGQRLN
ncbi:MAG: hypothetical protein PUJ42_07190, partial [Bacteroidales bacterium]|nr:hypothetical protein [Bacteroidales bacterium]